MPRWTLLPPGISSGRSKPAPGKFRARKPTSFRCRCSLTGQLGAGTQPNWATLPRELWQLILRRALDSELDVVEASDANREVCGMASLARCCCLISNLAATCRSLRGALLNQQDTWLGVVATLCSTWPSLAPRPARRLNQFRAALGLSRAPTCLGLAERSHGLNSFMARHAGHALIVRGGGWCCGELLELLLPLKHLDTLALAEIRDAGEAACLGALRDCNVREVMYRGSQPVAFPTSVRVLSLTCSFCGDKACRALFECLMPLRQVTSLVLDQDSMRLSSSDIKRLACWLPQLQDLTLTLAVTSRAGVHSLRALSLLSRSILIDLTLREVSVDFGSNRLSRQLEELRDVHLLKLRLDCSLGAGFRAEHEALLSQITVMRKLTMCFANPSQRLQQQLQVPRVVYEEGWGGYK